MNVGAVILAAGPSTRLGQPKQLVYFGGETLIYRSVNAAVLAGCHPVVAVLGAHADASEREIAELPAQVVHNSEWPEGMASSIRCGIRELRDSVDAAILLVCDQPHVSAALLSDLMRAHTSGKTIVGSHYSGTIGVPALFDRVHFDELLSLSGDVGAKSLFERHADALAVVPFGLGALDVDAQGDTDILVNAGRGCRPENQEDA